MSLRILHTSDWHIGRKLNGIYLGEFQRKFFSDLAQTIDKYKVDVLCVAGDIFDRSRPADDDLRLFSQFLSDITQKSKVKVCISSGNHDSAALIEYGRELFSGRGIYVSSLSEKMLTPVVLRDTRGREYEFYLIPYLDPKTAESIFSVKFESQNEIYKYICSRIQSENKGRSSGTVILVHLFAGGGLESDSERALVGGLDGVSTENFSGFSYVAAGHLHRFQAISETVFYSGSPLQYSFSEEFHKKSLWLVTLNGDEQGRLPLKDQNYLNDVNNRVTERIPLPKYYDLTTLRGKLSVLLDEGEEKYRAGMSPRRQIPEYYKVILEDKVPQIDAVARLKKYYPGLIEFEYGGNSAKSLGGSSGSPSELSTDMSSDVSFVSRGKELIKDIHREDFLYRLSKEFWNSAGEKPFTSKEAEYLKSVFRTSIMEYESSVDRSP